MQPVAYFPDDADVADRLDAEQILDGRSRTAARRSRATTAGVAMDAFEPTKIRDGV